MRLLLAALAGFALAVVPALAASDHSVKSVEGNQWSPVTVEVETGDRVVWSNGDGGFHNVHFEDESFRKPAQPAPTWPEEVARTFDTAGSHTYVCDAHPNMRGTVVVRAGGTTTTTGTTTTGTTTTQTQTTTTAPPRPVVRVRATRSTFCARRSRRCRRSGVFLRITSDTPHRAVGTLLRGGRTFGTVAFDLPAGTRIVFFLRTREGDRIARGRYTLRLGSAPAVRFRVR